MGLFKPAWQSKNGEKARKMVEKISDQTKLLRIARYPTTNWEARKAAINKLTDQAVLADFAKHGDQYVRGYAIKNLTDQVALAYIAQNDEKYYNRCEAAEKLTDKALAQKTFADVVKYAPNTHACNRAVRNLTDQTILAEVANCSSDYDILIDVAKKLTDHALAQKIFIDSAMNAPQALQRCLAIYNLTDPVGIADVAKREEKEADVQKAILTMITSQDFPQETYADIAKHSPQSHIRSRAFAKLTDPALIAEVAKKEVHYDVRPAVIEVLKRGLFSQELYADIAANAAYFEISMAAVNQLTDQTILADLAKNHNDSVVRSCAVHRLTVPALIAEVAKKETDNFVCEEIIKRFGANISQEIYADIAKCCVKDHDENYMKETDICLAAIRNLTDQSALADLVKNSKDGFARNAAVDRLTDKGILTDIANGTDDSFYMCSWLQKVLDFSSEIGVGSETKQFSVDLRETARKRLAKLGC